MFWKKDDDFDFDHLADKELGGHNTSLQEDLGLEEKSLFPEEPSFEPQSIPRSPLEQAQFAPLTQAKPSFRESPQQQFSSRDLELISSKLDTIKAMLSSLEQRMTQVEKAVGAEQKSRLW